MVEPLIEVAGEVLGGAVEVLIDIEPRRKPWKTLRRVLLLGIFVGIPVAIWLLLA